jgi:hypothetical protein
MNNIMATRTGISTMTNQAPSMNFTVVTTTATIPVAMQPTRLMASRCCQPRSRVRSQCRIMPAWLMVKSMKTPTA